MKHKALIEIGMLLISDVPYAGFWNEGFQYDRRGSG